MTFQNSEILSRKSSASSTGSLERGIGTDAACKLSSSIKRGPGATSSIANSVKAKIAMFSSRTDSATSIGCNSATESLTNSLTRSLTHTDVRYEEAGSLLAHSGSKIVPKSIAAYRSMVNVNSATAGSTTKTSNHHHQPNFGHNSRSQSLMEIGNKMRSLSHDRNHRSLSSSGLIQDRTASATSSSMLTKMVIPENSNESSSSSSASSSSKALMMSTPPWKENSTFPKYSPAFKRKPFTVYYSNGSNGGTSPPSSAEQQRNSAVKSDDSDNDSAVSSGRSSLSHSSVSPPNSPRRTPRSSNKAKPDLESRPSVPPALPPTGAGSPLVASSDNTSASEVENQENNNPRVLKKDSIEAINRRNILESCKKSSAKPVATVPWNGKPASRSSSFTIAERKKSFEVISTNGRTLVDSKNTSSQDSLSRKSSREYDSAFTSRRPSSATANTTEVNSSRRGSETLAETIKDIENRVAQMSESALRTVDDDKW